MPNIDKDVQKEAVKEALKEWLDSQWIMFGKFSAAGIISAVLAFIVWMWFKSQGWAK